MKKRASLPALPPAGAAAGLPGRGDEAGLREDLRAILPPERLVSSPDDLFAYECDAQTLDRALPLAVALPETTDEVAALVRACDRRGVPFVPRGAGTGLSGGAVAAGSLVLCTARMNRILEVDIPNRQACVQAGVVNAALDRVVRPHGLHFAPDPSSQYSCTIAGNVAENAGGPHTLKYGVTANHVLGLEVVLPDGTVAELGGPAADAPGYDLAGTFVGSEGTFGIATKVRVRLTPLPEGVRTMMAVFDTVVDASRGVTGILARGTLPAALEMIDQKVLRAVEAHIRAGLPADAGAMLVIEVDGLAEDLETQVRSVMEACRAAGARDLRLARDEAERAALWKGRKQAFGALGRLAPNYYTHDGVIPRTKLPEALAEIGRIGEKHGLTIANVFHAGDGNLHPVVLYDERQPGIIGRVRAAGEEIIRLVARLGGALSGEHGIGLEKIAYMRDFYAEEDLEEMRRLRDVFNPRGLCNPGKLIPARGGGGP